MTLYNRFSLEMNHAAREARHNKAYKMRADRAIVDEPPAPRKQEDYAKYRARTFSLQV